MKPRFTNSFLSFFHHLFTRAQKNHADSWAAGISFYLMLSLPALCTVVLAGVRSLISEEELTALLLPLIPSTLYEDVLQGFIEASYQQPLGISLLASFAIALFSASKIFGQLEAALHDLWDIPSLLPQKYE